MNVCNTNEQSLKKSTHIHNFRYRTLGTAKAETKIEWNKMFLGSPIYFFDVSFFHLRTHSLYTQNQTKQIKKKSIIYIKKQLSLTVLNMCDKKCF